MKGPTYTKLANDVDGQFFTENIDSNTILNDNKCHMLILPYHYFSPAYFLRS